MKFSECQSLLISGSNAVAQSSSHRFLSHRTVATAAIVFAADAGLLEAFLQVCAEVVHEFQLLRLGEDAGISQCYGNPVLHQSSKACWIDLLRVAPTRDRIDQHNT